MNIHMDQNFLNAKARGIEAPYAVGFMPFDEKDGRIVLKNINRDQLAQDAALSTQPNVGAPAALYTYVDPRIIDVLFGVTNATKFFDKTLVGSFTQDYATFSVEEVAGQVSPYNDFANGTSTDVNYNFPVRQNFRYQTTIKYGDLETAKLAEANVNLPARKQNAAALVFNDVNKLWQELTANNGGHLDVNAPIVLGISNKMIGYLTQPNQFGKTAKVMLQENYPNIEIVQLPELSTAAGEMLYMTVKEVYGDETGFSAFSRAFGLGRLIAHESSFTQKATAGTWGCVIRRPSLVATMVGI